LRFSSCGRDLNQTREILLPMLHWFRNKVRTRMRRQMFVHACVDKQRALTLARALACIHTCTRALQRALACIHTCTRALQRALACLHTCSRALQCALTCLHTCSRALQYPYYHHKCMECGVDATAHLGTLRGDADEAARAAILTIPQIQ
jgi:hypothetical protein